MTETAVFPATETVVAVARPRTLRVHRGKGFYPVTVGGYIVGAVQKTNDKVGANARWAALDEHGNTITRNYESRQHAVARLARTEEAAAAYRAAALEGAFGIDEQRAAEAHNETVVAQLEAEQAQAAPKAVVVRTAGGDYQVRLGGRNGELLRNCGRRAAEAHAYADRRNAQIEADRDGAHEEAYGDGFDTDPERDENGQPHPGDLPADAQTGHDPNQEAVITPAHLECRTDPCPYCKSVRAALDAADEPEPDDTYLDPRDEPWEGIPS